MITHFLGDHIFLLLFSLDFRKHWSSRHLYSLNLADINQIILRNRLGKTRIKRIFYLLFNLRFYFLISKISMTILPTLYMLLIKMIAHATIKLRDLLLTRFIAEKIVLFTVVITKMIIA